MTYGAVEWSSYLDMILDLPLLIAQFIFSPLPIFHHIFPTIWYVTQYLLPLGGPGTRRLAATVRHARLAAADIRACMSHHRCQQLQRQEIKGYRARHG